jgi:hypothetical protein
VSVGDFHERRLPAIGVVRQPDIAARKWGLSTNVTCAYESAAFTFAHTGRRGTCRGWTIHGTDEVPHLIRFSDMPKPNLYSKRT